METDSTEKVDTKHGICYSHLLAAISVTHSGTLIQATNLLNFLFFLLSQNYRTENNAKAQAQCGGQG